MAKKEITKKSKVSTKKAAPKITATKTTAKATTKIAVKSTVKTKAKTTPKTSVKTRTAVQAHAVETPAKTKTKETVTTSPKKPVIKFRKPYLFWALAIVLLGALLYTGRGLFIAAVVNGQPISRMSVIHEAEKQSGRQSLDTLVRNTLIEQEARKANVTVSKAEVDTQVKKVEDTFSKQGQKLDDVLAMQGLTRPELEKLLRLEILVGKIVGKNVSVSDKEVNDYLAANKEFLPQDQSEEQLKKTATEQVKQQKLNDKIRTWLESVQTKARIMYFVQY